MLDDMDRQRVCFVDAKLFHLHVILNSVGVRKSDSHLRLLDFSSGLCARCSIQLRTAGICVL